MTAYIVLSTATILTTIIGCALIWGYDLKRAVEIERGFPPPVASPQLQAATPVVELETRALD